GGGDPGCTAATGEPCDPSTPDVPVANPSNVTVTKGNPTIANVSGTQYTATYVINVQNTGGVPGTYTLTDTPGFSNTGVTLNSWTVTPSNGGVVNPSLPAVANNTAGQISASSVSIAGGVTHTYTVVITFTMGTGATLACNGNPNNGAYNAAGITGSATGNSSGCGSLPNPPKVTATKTASASPLLVGVSGQSYAINVTITNGPTTAPIAIADTLPTGITLSGAPSVSGATLSGCNGAGSSSLGAACVLSSPLNNGTYTITVPITVAAPIGAQSGNNTANLSGGGDPGCTAATGEPCDPSTPDVPVANPSNVTVTKGNPTIANVSGAQYTATYVISVQNTGGVPGTYTLTDTPAFPNTGVTLSPSWSVSTVGGTLNSPLPSAVNNTAAQISA
ncbi:MAG: hypothetical protein JSR65_07075, partial [Proteobacteria bacterium]|nr:hypothetical protein [Pseudomonadota bacterium]